MRDYVPIKGPLKGKQFIPSNGTDGYAFIESWCAQCSRDKPCSEGKDFDDCTDDEVCEILGASFRGEAVEWRRLDDGETVCVAFIGSDQPVTRRCENTIDMFETASK
jgi:hypothetical protein